MNGDITFNSNDLQTFSSTTKVGINTNVINHTDIPDKVASIFAKADANGSSISAINYPNKKVSIGGTIHGSTQDDLDSRIDAFKGYFNTKGANLDIDYSGSTRRYVATSNAIGIERQQKVLWAKFTVEFICTEPFGKDTTATSITNSLNYTLASLTVAPTIGGSAPVQYPIITLTLDALTGTGDYIQITNNTSDQLMLLYGFSFTAGDVIVIDAFERTVTINGVEVDYLGTFLELEPGAQSLTYTDGFTTRQVDIVITYYKRWL